MILQITRIPHRLSQARAFVAAKVKWVRDPFLDCVVQKEKNLKQVISLKNLIVSSALKCLPLSSLSLLRQDLKVPTTTTSKFFHLYPNVFIQFQPSVGLHPHVKLTPQALALHNEESSIHNSQPHQDDTVERLAKLLMLTGAGKLPLYVIERLQWDLGLPHKFIPTLLADYPEYFQVCSVKDCSTGEPALALELLSWRKDLSVSELKKRDSQEGNARSRGGNHIAFPMSFPRGFDLEKRVRNWVDEWQRLPYISPYQNAFHLPPNGDQAEKWTVAVLHELLHLMVSKKTEKENILCLGEYLGFGSRFKKALVHHPDIVWMCGSVHYHHIMPAAAALIGNSLGLSPSLLVGLILLGCCPGGGTASNVVTLIAQGDVPLSIVMTVCTTLEAVILTLFLTKVLAGAYVPVDAAKLSISTLQVLQR